MKFKIGDHVRVISRTDRYFDEVGVVVEIDGHPGFEFLVARLQDHPLWYGTHELILAESETQTATQDATGVAEGVEVPRDASEAGRAPLTGRCKIIGCSVTLTHGRWTHDSMRDLVLCIAVRMRA